MTWRNSNSKEKSVHALKDNTIVYIDISIIKRQSLTIEACNQPYPLVHHK
jgi:hypothetical protein